MADNTIESRGFEVFISTDGTAVTKIICPTAITGGGVSGNTTEIDCLDAAAAYDRPTGKKLNAWNVPFIVQQGDTGHQFLLSQMDSSSLDVASVPFAIGWSDGAADPTITAGAFTPAAGRSFIAGNGYVTGVTFDVSQGDVVRGSFTILPTSQTVTYKA